MTEYRYIAAFIVLVCAVFGFYAIKAQAADAPPAIGTPAPDFHLKSQEGKTVSLGDYKEQWVVVYFYPKDFTSGCTIEAHAFQADLPRYEARHAVILGISVDSAESHKSFCTKEGLNFKLLSDADHKVSAAYGSLKSLGPIAMAARNTFIVDPDGKIAKSFIGVKPATHSTEVLAALDELQKK